VTSLSGLVAALLAAAAPSHGAQRPVLSTSMLARPAQVVRVLRVPDKQARACTVRRQHAEAQAGRIERAMEPVACEQPPRSKVILTFSGGLFGSGR
jgi:hypothetical protein